MNAEEIALEFEQYLKEIEEQPWGNHEIYLSEAIQMLRQLQKERDLLFSAHSVSYTHLTLPTILRV